MVGIGTVIKTEDGGETWIDQAFGEIKDFFWGHFFDSDNGIVRSDTLYATSDGGEHWYPIDNGKRSRSNSIFFVDRQNGWSAGDEGYVCRTQDGGAQWECRSISPYGLIDVCFTDVSNGWLFGYGGKNFHTSNGGTTWLPQESGTDNPLYAAAFENRMSGWAVGVDGVILYTADGGTHWLKQSTGAFVELSSVYFVDRRLGWAVGGNGSIFKTTNGGGTWIEKRSKRNSYLHTVFFIDSRTGWAGGHDVSILKTTDGGETWSEVAEAWNQIRSIHFVDELHGWAIIDGGILSTTDGGYDWSYHSTMDELQWPRTVFFINRQIGWVMGDGTVTKVLKTTDGGLSWYPQNSGGARFLFDCHFYNENTGWAVGLQGTIIHMDDGGSTWISQTSNTSYELSSVHFIDENNGWIVGGGGTYNNVILRTTDGGDTWDKVDFPTINPLRGVHFVNADHGWAVGGGGTILKWGSPESGSDTLTHRPFVLMGNYPNPFNKSTRITYSMAIPGFVTLKIYDILGKEVQSLVNEPQEAQAHSIDFDAKGLASGVYFYRLQVGDGFVETKKMLLIR